MKVELIIYTMKLELLKQPTQIVGANLEYYT